MEDPLDEVTAIELQIEDEREEEAWLERQKDQAVEDAAHFLAHHEGDVCDLDDPHDRWHHDTDDDLKANHYCSHPECRADDLNDDLKVGF